MCKLTVGATEKITMTIMNILMIVIDTEELTEYGENMMRLTKNFEAGGILLRVLSGSGQLVVSTALQALPMVRLHKHNYSGENHDYDEIPERLKIKRAAGVRIMMTMIIHSLDAGDRASQTL